MAKSIPKRGKGSTNVYGGSTYPVAAGIGTQTSKSVPSDKVTKAKTGKVMTYGKPNSAPKKGPGKKAKASKPRKTKKNSYQVKL